MSRDEYPPVHEMAERVNDGARSLMHFADDYLRRSAATVTEEQLRRLADAVDHVERALESLGHAR